jgi:hypothetical protein
MNSLKPFLSRFSSPNWQIRVEKKDGWNFVEITDHFSSLRANQTILYLDLLESVFTQYKEVYLSQKVDQRQWNVGNCKNFADRIQENFSANVSLSSDFDSPNLPEVDDREFVLHTINPFNRGMWQEIVRFGMFNLPNFAYSLDGLTDTSPNSLFDINKVIVSWFHLKTDNSEFAKILKTVSPIFLTIDGHLCFFVSSGKEFDKLIETLNRLSERHSLKPVIKQSTIQA